MVDKKINLNSVAALRTECDESLAQVMSSLKYTQDFFESDLKLALGYVSAIIAGGLYYYEKKITDDLRDPLYFNLVFGGVVLFFFIQAGLYLHAKFVAPNSVYVGHSGKAKVRVSTSTKSATTPVYDVVFDLDGVTTKDSIPFAQLFTEDGFLQQDRLAAFVSKSLAKKSI